MRCSRFSPLLWIVSAIAIVSVACQPIPSSSSAPFIAASATTLPATERPVWTPTAVRTPPSLPGIYQSSYLNALDTPRTYLADTCQYLRDKWDSSHAAPGTIVLVVMLHSITKGHLESKDAMGVIDFARMMDDLHEQKFQAVNAQQLADFLDHNAKIPSRSVLLMQDGRRFADNFNKHFRFYWDQWNWSVVNAWDSEAVTTQALLDENVALENEGWVDHQVYGISLDASSTALSEQYFTYELQKALTTFQTQFTKTPVAIVWPSGLDLDAVQAARGLGYRLGFTSNARGPLMFNWVPLAESMDTLRPSYAPEGAIGDPLMTLPRYWPYQVHTALDSVRVMGKEASAYAEQNKATELEYYDIVCAPTYGPIP